MLLYDPRLLTLCPRFRGYWDEDGLRIQVLELTLQCHVLDSAGAGDAHPGCMSRTWDDAMGCNGHLLPILGFLVFHPKLSLLQLQPLSRGFFFWESKVGMSHPLLMTGAHIPHALPDCFAGLGSRPGAAEGTTLSPESSNGKFSENPAFLAVSPQLCRWMELNWINFRRQEPICTPRTGHPWWGSTC